MNLQKMDTEYINLLDSLKQKIRTAQVKAVLSVNAEMILLYWEIGKSILERQTQEGWGQNIINKLSQDLKTSFPEMKGFSPRNLGYMKKFAKLYQDEVILQQLAAKLPWWHNVVLMDKITSTEERLWYAKGAIEFGWSRNVLVHQIESGLYQRQVLSGKITNFEKSLPAPQSELVRDMLKDPYKLDFLGIGQEAQEKEIENALVAHMKKFLLELGAGFAFVGQQYHLDIGGDDFYIDLLFYHIKLKCYVVIELKAQKFKPEFAGKLNFYLSVVDDILRDQNDNPTIGILLCKTKDNVLAEYALKDINKPIGISEYNLSKALPEKIRTGLPTIEQLEEELAGIEEPED
jgi:predicted nuclease of restriction endonuclease-like (RecB) superfamily